MTKKHEELVEEIAQDILEYYRPDGFVEVMKWDREFAEGLITLILSAVRDGRLDEELGVVGRTEIDVATPITSGLLAFFQTWLREAITQKEAKVVIALRGTGKEEKEEK